MSYSDDFSEYLNQSVTWSQKTGQDGFNKPTYSESTIAARKEKRVRMVRDAFGEQVVSNTTIFTQSNIGAEDMIDGEKVIQPFDMVDGEGNVIGYEVLV